MPSRPGRVGVGGWGPPRGQDINHQPLCTRSVLHALQAHPRRRFRAQGSSLNNPVAPFQGSRPECPILLGRPATAAQLAPLSRPCSQPRDLAPPQPPPAATSHAWRFRTPRGFAGSHKSQGVVSRRLALSHLLGAAQSQVANDCCWLQVLQRPKSVVRLQLRDIAGQVYRTPCIN